MDDGSELDCRSCGACCHGDDGWVHVGREDEARVVELGSLVVFVNGRRSLRMAAGTCAGLRREEGRFTCSIYDFRPSACRDVQPGDRWCVAARARVRT